MFGNWEVNVSTNMPQKVATAVAGLNDMVGASYTPIAYLGSQVVNGTNHAVLAEQQLVLGKDTKNIVVLIFHETKEGVALANIERVVESGDETGGIVIDPKTPVPAEAEGAFKKAMGPYISADIDLFALLATQVTKGTNYYIAATITPIVPNGKSTVVLINANGMTEEISITDILGSKQDASLGYAFTWLKR